MTGAAGFIGSHVVRRLAEEGCEVVALVLSNDPGRSLLGWPVELSRRVTRVDGDLSDPHRLAQQMQGASLVIHLAAIYAIWLPRPALMWEVNVEGTRHVMRAAKAAKIRRVVHTSSIAAIGSRPGMELADEELGFNDWAIADDYVLSKYVSELEALAFNGGELEVVSVNPAFPFGANDTGPTPTGKMVADTLAGRMPFVVEGGFNAVDVRDVAEGHLLGAMFGQPGRRYILGGHNVEYREFSEKVAAIAGTKPPRVVVPTPVIRGAGQVLGFVADHLTRKKPMMTGRSVAYLSGRWLWFSIERARAELGYAPRPLEDAIRSSVAWFQG
ncbi:MAG TPA: NAD-dependent epimerase/dehydratase family protein [Myxococcota bacterium]|nr:NAD-dependent epimerase/dehydratase family protein [Myxococcota bacterium]